MRRPATFEGLFAHWKQVGYLHIHIVHTGSDWGSKTTEPRRTPRFDFRIITKVSSSVCEHMPGRCKIVRLHDVGGSHNI